MPRKKKSSKRRNSKKKLIKLRKRSKKYENRKIDHEVFCIANRCGTCYMNVFFCIMWDIIEFRELMIKFDTENITYKKDNNLLCYDFVSNINTNKERKKFITGAKYNRMFLTCFKNVFNMFNKYTHNNRLRVCLNNTIYDLEGEKITYYDVFTAVNDPSDKYDKRTKGYSVFLYMCSSINRLSCISEFDGLFENVLVKNKEEFDDKTCSKFNYYMFIYPPSIDHGPIRMQEMINNFSDTVIYNPKNKYLILLMGTYYIDPNTKIARYFKNVIIDNKITLKYDTYYLKGVNCGVLVNTTEKSDVVRDHVIYIKYDNTKDPNPITVFNDHFFENDCWISYDVFMEENKDFKIEVAGEIYLYEKR